MKIYKIAAEQLDLFDKPKQAEPPKTPRKEPTRSTKSDISHIKLVKTLSDQYNVHTAVFKIDDAYYAYVLSFPDWLIKIKQMSYYSEAKALAWAKNKASAVYEVTSEYPMPGTIIREVK